MKYTSKLILNNTSDYSKLISEELDKHNYKGTSHPNVLEVVSEKQSMGIALVRNLIEFAYKKSYSEGAKLIFLVDAHKLTKEAQNALLKVLEDTPEFTQIILLANSEGAFLDTVLSRVQKHFSTNQNQNTLESPINLNDLKDRIALLEFLTQLSQKDNTIIRENLNALARELISSSLQNSTLVKAIENSVTKVNANCNKKLVLDNLFIKFQKHPPVV